MEHALQQLLAVRPFAPFKIRMSNGDSHIIREPDLAMLDAGGTVVVFRRQPDTQHGRERAAVLALHHVVALLDDDTMDIPY
jgi:hypothetical protein